MRISYKITNIHFDTAKLPRTVIARDQILYADVSYEYYPEDNETVTGKLRAELAGISSVYRDTDGALHFVETYDKTEEGIKEIIINKVQDMVINQILNQREAAAKESVFEILNSYETLPIDEDVIKTEDSADLAGLEANMTVLKGGLRTASLELESDKSISGEVEIPDIIEDSDIVEEEEEEVR